MCKCVLRFVNDLPADYGEFAVRKLRIFGGIGFTYAIRARQR